MLRIIYGSAKSGKTTKLFKEIMELMPTNGHPLILIVPEQFTLEAEKQFINHSASEGIIGLDVLSFKRLAHKVINAHRVVQGVEIDDVGQLMMLTRLSLEIEQDLMLYRTQKAKRGFLLKSQELIKEFKQNRITPEALKALSAQFDDQPVISNKLHDFGLLFEAYEKMKAGLYYDEEDRYNALLEAIATSEMIKGAHIWLDNFDSFTVQELEIIYALASHADNVTLTLCFDQLPVFEHTGRFYSRLVSEAKDRHIKVETIKCEAISSNPMMHQIALNLQTYPYRTMINQSLPIQLISADHRYNEVKYCASELIRLVREEGMAWHDFAVITADLDIYGPIVKRVFEEIGLPFFIDQKVKITGNPLVQFIFRTLELYRSRFASQAIVDWVKSDFIAATPLELSAFEWEVLSKGVRERKLLNPSEPWERFGVPLETIRQTVVDIIDERLKASKMTVKTAIEALVQIMSKLDVKGKIDQRVNAFKSSGDFDEAQKFAQVWNLMISLFDQLNTLMGNQLLSLEEIYEVLEAGFDVMEVGLLPLSEDQVLIGTIDRSRSHPIKHLFFLGFNDGIVPEIGKDQQLFLEAEKSALKEKGIALVSNAEMFASKERFNLYFALTRPSVRTFISYSRADSEGAVLRPSYLVSKLLKICPNLKTIETNEIPAFAISTREGTASELAIQMRKALDGYAIHPIWHATHQWYQKNSPDVIAYLNRGAQHTNIAEALDAQTVLDLYQLPIHTSVSGLEQYVQCPFKYFTSAGLRPLVFKPFELAAPDIGTLFHSVLEHFGKEVYQKGYHWNSLDKNTCDVMVTDIVSHLTDGDIFHSRFQYQYLAQKLLRVSKKAVWTLTTQLKQGRFEPAAFEVAFGMNKDSAPPLMIPLVGDRKLAIRGVIDRVDQLTLDDCAYVRIIDYKSGMKSLSLNEIYHGLQMQLMVYLTACVENPEHFHKEAVSAAGAFYFKIDDPLIDSTERDPEKVKSVIEGELKLDGLSVENREVLEGLDQELFELGSSKVVQVRLKNDGAFTKDSKVLPEEALSGLMQHVKKTITQVGNEIVSGKIDILPIKNGQSTSCTFCDYRAICQFDSQLPGNRYKQLEPLDTETIIERVVRGINHDKMD